MDIIAYFCCKIHSIIAGCGINKKIISKTEYLAGQRFALHGQKAFFVGLTADGLVLERQQNACAANAVGAGALVFAEAELGQPEPVVLLVNNIISRQIRRFERCKLSRSVRRKFRVGYAVDGHQNIRAGLKSPFGKSSCTAFQLPRLSETFADAYYSFSQVYDLRLDIRYSKMGGTVNLNFNCQR